MAVPKALSDRLGEEATEAFVEVMSVIGYDSHKDLATKEDLAKLEGRLNERISSESGKVNIEIGKVNERISSEIGKVNDRISSEIGKVNIEIGKVNDRITSLEGRINERMTSEIGKVNERITSLEGSLRLEMEKLRVEVAKYGVETAKSGTEIIRWMFLFWIGQLAAMAMLFKFFGK